MDPLDAVLARFQGEYLEMHSISAGRQEEQEKILRRLAATLDHPLVDMTPQDMRVFVGGELTRGVSPRTALKYQGMIRSFVTWGFEAGLIPADRTLQLKSVSNPRGSTGTLLPKPYKVHEIKSFYAQLAAKYPALPGVGRGSRGLHRFLTGRVPHLRRHVWRHARRLQFEAQIALALEQALRRIEIARLTIPALHYDNDQIVVLTAKQGPGSNVSRSIPYAMHARSVMQQWLDFRYLLTPGHDEPWLSLHYGEPIEQQLRPMSFGQMGNALRCFHGGWRWHRFRHTAATEWLRSGVPLEKVRVYMGHANIDQTLLYTEIVSSDVDAAFSAAEADFARRLGLAA